MKVLIGFLLSGIAYAMPITSNNTLIGGEPDDNGDYPEIVYIQVEVDGQKGACSASIIGEETLVTAGHCVDQGGVVTFSKDDVDYSAKCDSHDKAVHDMALCKLDKKIDVKPASISKVGPKLREPVILSGYGCIKSPGTGGNDGILRFGEAPVVKLPKGKDNSFYTYGKTAICFGDSGGPSFLKGTHKQIGINSRGNISTLSLMTALWLDDSQKFLADFAKEQDVEICGVNKDC